MLRRMCRCCLSAGPLDGPTTNSELRDEGRETDEEMGRKQHVNYPLQRNPPCGKI